MAKKKICDFGDKKIAIAADTIIEYGNISGEALAKWGNVVLSSWIEKSGVVLKMDAWIKLCEEININGQYSGIWDHFIDKSSLAIYRNEIKSLFEIRAVRAEQPNAPLTDIGLCNCNSEDCWRNPYYYDDKGKGQWEVWLLSYPMDYLTLLRAAEKIIEDEKEMFPLKKKVFSKGLKPGMFSYRWLNLQSAIDQNKEYFDRFKRCMSTQDSQIAAKQYSELKKCERKKEPILALRVDDELFIDGCWNFDIKKKYEEVSTIKEKLLNSNDPGEKKVDYAIKWCTAELGKPVVEIKRNCESKYRYDCILLAESDFIDEAQEYDHIFVCDAGVILIETKNWSGQVEIRPDGKWLRDKENSGSKIGTESPAFQMHRHELLMKKILPNVPVYSVLCFSNSSVILDGIENFSDFPIVYIEKLKEKLSEIILSGENIPGGIDYVVNEIDKHKIHVMSEGDFCDD